MKSQPQTSKSQTNPKHQIPISKRFGVLDLGFWICFEVGILMLGFSKPSLAQTTQFYLEDKLNEKWNARIYIVGDAAAKNQVQEALYKAVDHARETLKKLDPANPTGELGRINQKKERGSFMVSEELSKAISAGLDVARWTGGVFDFTYEAGEGSFRDVKISAKTNELKIKRSGIVINLRYLMRGFLADLIAEDLQNAGWRNCFVKIEDMYVAKGNDTKGPWKFPIATPDNKLAKRLFLYKVSEDAAAATLTTNRGPIEVLDPRTKSLSPSDLKSVTVFTQSSARAEGLATAVYVMGFEEGKKFAEKNKGLRVVFVDSEGQFTHIPEFTPVQ